VNLLVEPLRKRILGEMLAPFIRSAFWQIAMHRALETGGNDREIFDDFYEPFSGIIGPWKFMQVLRWGKPAEMLAQGEGANALPETTRAEQESLPIVSKLAHIAY
jgi:hypothetical protein